MISPCSDMFAFFPSLCTKAPNYADFSLGVGLAAPLATFVLFLIHTVP